MFSLQNITIEKNIECFNIKTLSKIVGFDKENSSKNPWRSSTNKLNSIMVRYSIIILFFSITSTFSALAQEAQDTTKTVKAVKDTVIRIPLRNHGKIIHIKDEPNITIRKQDIQDINYTGLSDILQKKTPFYSQNQGSFGLFNSFSIFGAKPRSINFQFNGRNINDLDLGSLNPEQISTEFLESVEVFYGSDAVILADNAAGSLINIQEIRYNTEKPFTRLWFSEAGFEYLAADAVFSQNFARDWNFTMGLRTMATDGLYKDSWMNDWNFRGILRWNPSDGTSISLTENFTNHGIGTGGGVDYNNNTDIYDPISAISFFPGLNEREFRHDITLSLTSFLDSAKTQSFNSNIYLSNSIWDRSSGSSIQFAIPDSDKTYTSYSNFLMGINGSYELFVFNNVFLKAGGNFDYNNVPANFNNSEFIGVSAGGYGRLSFNPIKSVEISGGARLTNKFEQTAASFGGRIKNTINDKFYWLADASYSERIPDLVEGRNLKNEKHLLGFFETGINLDSINIIKITFFVRKVSSPVVTSLIKDTSDIVTGTKSRNEEEYTSLGGIFNYKTKLFDLINLDMTMQANYQTLTWKKNGWLPNLSLNAEIYYQYSTHRSILRGGLESSFATQFTGERFIPFNRTYIDSDFKSETKLQTINAFVYIKIGNAFVKATFENLLSQKYFNIPVYPALTRNFKLSVAWTFLEN